MKLTRPPKWNRSGDTCTMRIYCTKFMGRNNPDGCQFGITLKYEHGKWITTEEYKFGAMAHYNH